MQIDNRNLHNRVERDLGSKVKNNRDAVLRTLVLNLPVKDNNCESTDYANMAAFTSA